MTDLLPLIRANAAKSWDALANETVSYGDFTGNWDKLGSAPSATEYVSALDYTELDAAISKAENIINTNNSAVNPFTEDSINKLQKAVNDAKEIRVSATTEEELQNAVNVIIENYNYLAVGEIAENVTCNINASFVSSKVYVGKVANLNVQVDNNRTIIGVDITYKNGKYVEHITDYYGFKKSTNKTKNIYRVLFKPTEDQVAYSQEYTIRVIFADGTVSNDSITKNLNVRG